MAYRKQHMLVAMLLLCLGSLGAPIVFAQEASTGFDVGFEPVAEGFSQPVGITHAGDSSGVLYVIERGGTIRQIIDSERVDGPFLDITDRIGANGMEQGLLGLAFPPDFAESRLFYVDYTDLDGNTVVSRFRVADNGVGDPDSEQIILRQQQPFSNHNGGQLAFGPDGYLYIGLGDGGSQGDPNGNAQNTHTWLGKILRIDVDPVYVPDGELYGIPEDNPFADGEGGLPEIYAYGLRNPWRFSFDGQTGELFIADVGQSWIEEIDIPPVNPDTPMNFGWNTMEGSSCYLEDGCDTTGLELPVMEYTHEGANCSVTGGGVYYGENLPSLYGSYIFADFCSGYVWQGTKSEDGAWVMSDPVLSGLTISSFGTDEDGEMYVVDLNSGIVYRLEEPL